jgi:hypothetical protein
MPSRGKEVKTVKTRIEMPEELWEAAKNRATKEPKHLRDVIAEALRERLNIKPKEVMK